MTDHPCPFDTGTLLALGFPEPIPYRGALGLWQFPDELLPEVSW